MYFKLGTVEYRDDVSTYLTHLTSENPLVNILLKICFEISIFLNSILPFTAFSLFYIAVCTHLRLIIEKFAKILKKRDTCIDFNLSNFYSALKTTAEYIDDQLSFLVFITVAYNGCFMYLSVSAILHAEPTAKFIDRLYLFWHLINSLFLFICMTATASFVYEASMEVLAVASRISAVAEESSFLLQKFISFAEKGISLTVWKASPISRNFIFGILGAIFTYAVLFDNLSIK
ncbi:hypothetical protein AVEN_53302-1 [Araneus ventricosus]|uniref:Uncharacterized protein n=1 Tax=Araneus ventricosus TaxID=182803 RepID=A0A4Y2ABI4_ARAVE|nr:hypothetical protein AVEN_53302-1 [Araneus ventricosus]